MPKLPAFFVAWTFAGLTIVNPAVGQDGRWFRVELLVFANESPESALEGAARAEHWEATPSLAYPGAARFLIDPQRVAANMAGTPADSKLDEFGRQILTILPEQDASVEIIGGGSDPVARPGPDTDGGLVTGAGPADGPDAKELSPVIEQPAADVGPRLPRPFVIQPAEQLEFRGKAAYMQRSGRYTTLFHETWLQPVGDEAGSLPVILDDSGNTGQWPRLQGSIRIYLSRYLHLETNLWLNTDGNYLPGSWKMPAPPLGPPSLIIEDLSNPEPEPADAPLAPDNEQQQSPLEVAGETGAITVAAVAPETVEPGTAGQADMAFGIIEEATPGEPAIEPVEVELPVYPYRHALLLQQKRRMRSTEVHYIDHPKFGLVIKLTPLSSEELAAQAEAEPAVLAPDNQAQ